MSPEKQTPILPIEIIELVVKNFAKSDPLYGRSVDHVDNLRRCCLVSKAWVPICQAQLFKFASLNKRRLTVAQRNKTVAQAILEIPHIAPYIQNIDYSAVLNDKGFKPNARTIALLKLPNLKSLQIQGSVLRPLDFNRCRMKGFGFLQFFDAYITSTSLTTLTIFGITDLPLIAVLSCPNLRSIHLSSCTFSNWNPTPQTTAPLAQTSKLEDLSLYDVRNFPYAVLGLLSHFRELAATGVSWYTPPGISKEQLFLPFGRLEKLEIDTISLTDTDSWVALPISTAEKLGIKLFEQLKELSGSPVCLHKAEEIARVLEHAPALRDLEFRLMNGEFIPDIYLHRHLAQSTGGLHNLSILCYIGDHDLKSLDTIQAISDSLSLLQSPSSLRSIKMRIIIQVPLLVGLHGLVRQLKALDATISVESDSPPFPLLNWITINIVVEHSGPSEYPVLLDGNMKADFYACVDSSFEGFKRSPRARLDVKLELFQRADNEGIVDQDSDDGYTSLGSDY